MLRAHRESVERNLRVGMSRKKKPMHENGFLPKRKEILGNAKANLYFPVDTRHDTDLLENMLP